METEQAVIAFLRARGADVGDAERHWDEWFCHDQAAGMCYNKSKRRTKLIADAKRHGKNCRNACVVAAMESRTVRFFHDREKHYCSELRKGGVSAGGGPIPKTYHAPTPFAALAALSEAK